MLCHARKIGAELQLTSAAATKLGLKVNQDGQRRSAFEMIAMPEVGLVRVGEIWPEIAALPLYAQEALEADSLYAGYVDRQVAEIHALRREDKMALPLDMDYMAIPSLSMELRLKLQRVMPSTLGQASRIEGMTPAALGCLLGYTKQRGQKRSA